MNGLKIASSMLMRLKTVSSYSNVRWLSGTLTCRCDVKTVPQDNTKSPEAVLPTELVESKKIEPLVEVASTFRINIGNFISCVKVSPELLEKSPVEWETCLKKLRDYGFSKNDCIRMIAVYPPIFTLTQSDEFDNAINRWLNCQLGYDNMLDLLAAFPQLITYPERELNRRIPLIKSLAKSKGKHVVRLIRACVNLMYDDWRDVMAKVDYIDNVMKIDSKKESLAKCYAFNRNLDEIKTRHMFLVRSGLYIPPKEVKASKLHKVKQPWSNNPLLKLITDTSEANFIARVAPQLTVEELEVFREMYKEELDKIEDDSDDEHWSDSE